MEDNHIKEQKYIRAKKRVKAVKGFYTHFLVYILVNAFILMSKVLADGGWEIFWEWHSYNTPLFWGIGLAFHALKVFGMNFILGKEWEERKIKQLMDKDGSDKWQ